MGQREAIAFGEGVATTMRMKFEKLEAHQIPGAHKHDDESAAHGEIDLAGIVERLRNVPKGSSSVPFSEPVGRTAASRAIPAIAGRKPRRPAACARPGRDRLRLRAEAGTVWIAKVS
jgi:hypothetical protein